MEYKSTGKMIKMKIKDFFQNRTRGWLPKEPVLKGHLPTASVKDEAKAALEQQLSKKLIKAISITNPIIGSVTFALSHPTGISWNLDTVILTFANLVLVLLVTNILVYLFIKHQTERGISKEWMPRKA